MDGFTSFIVYDVIEVFHKYIWRLFHVSKQLTILLHVAFFFED